MQPLYCVLSARPLHPTTCWIKTGSIWRNVIRKWMGHIRLSILFSGLYIIFYELQWNIFDFDDFTWVFSLPDISLLWSGVLISLLVLILPCLCLHWIDPDFIVFNALVTLLWSGVLSSLLVLILPCLCLHWIDPDFIVFNALVTLTPGDPQPQLWQTSPCFAKWFLKKEAMKFQVIYVFFFKKLYS